MQYNKKDIKKWVRALRSGKYEQTKQSLQDSEGFCCLGVACKLFNPNHPTETVANFLQGGLPERSFRDPEWLEKINNHFSQLTEIALSELNDEEEFTFDEIADVLEAVYILEVI